MVVRAEDEIQAREQASFKAMDEGKTCWLNADYSFCELLTENGEAQVICVDASNG